MTAPPVTFTETAHYAGFGSTHTLAINSRTGFAYAAGTRTCEGGLHVVDVRTPASPRAAGCFSLDGYTHETQCVVYNGPDTLYRDREICFNSNEDTLTIVDATDKLEQVQLSRTGYGGSAYTHQGWLTEDQRFFLVNDEGDEKAFRHPTRTWIWDVSDLDAPVIASHYDGPTPSIDHNLYIRGNLVYESNYRSGLRVLDASEIAQGVLREVGFFDIYPSDDLPGVQRRVVGVSVFRQRVGGRQRHRAGPVRRQPAHRCREGSRPASRSRSPDPATPRRSTQDWSFVVMVANHGPGPSVGDARHRNAAGDRATAVGASRRRASARSATVATCELGSLAPGSEAFVIVTIRATGERDLVSTAIVSARADDGSTNARPRRRRRLAASGTHQRSTLRRPVGRHDVLARAQQHGSMDAAWRHRRRQRRSVARRWRDVDEAERRGGEHRVLRLDRSGCRDVARKNPRHQRRQARAHTDLAQSFDRSAGGSSSAGPFVGSDQRVVKTIEGSTFPFLVPSSRWRQIEMRLFFRRPHLCAKRLEASFC